jgi:site-specific recombinase XerC
VRKTYISIALEESGDIALVSKMCGYKKIASTMIYAKISDNAKINLTRLMDAI